MENTDLVPSDCLNPVPPTPSVSNPAITLLQKSGASAPKNVALIEFDFPSVSVGFLERFR